MFSGLSWLIELTWAHLLLFHQSTTVCCHLTFLWTRITCKQQSNKSPNQQFGVNHLQGWKLIQSAGSWGSGNTQSILTITSINKSLVACLSAADMCHRSHVGKDTPGKNCPTTVDYWFHEMAASSSRIMTFITVIIVFEKVDFSVKEK